MQNVPIKRIGIIGCGWLGLPLAEYLVTAGYPLVKGSTTSFQKLELLAQVGVEGHLASLAPEPQGSSWRELLEVDTLIVDIPPRSSKQGEEFHPQQMEHLAELITNSKVSEIIYVSSTSVYEEVNRQVTEQDVVRADQSAAPFLVKAEHTLMALRGKNRHVTVLRCGGLMGYDRIPGKYVKGKKDMSTGDIPVNYVHRDDVVAILADLILHGVPDETFNCVAPVHPPRRDVYESSCEEFGWEPPTFSTPDSAVPFKVVSSEKITDFLNYTFIYSDPLAFYYSQDQISL